MTHHRWLAAALALALAWTMQPAAARQAQAAPATRASQPYGPVLYLNGKPVTDTTPRNPAAVRDETDTGASPAARPAPPQARPQLQPQGQVQAQGQLQPQPQGQVQSQPQGQARPQPQGQLQQSQGQVQQQGPRRTQAARRRHPAWQASGPMAPRALHGDEALTVQGLPLAPPVAAPEPLTPSSTLLNGCQGGFCTDASGNSYNGIGIGTGTGTSATGNAGVSSTGRLCSRTGATVQCF